MAGATGGCGSDLLTLEVGGWGEVPETEPEDIRPLTARELRLGWISRRRRQKGNGMLLMMMTMLILM